MIYKGTAFVGIGTIIVCIGPDNHIAVAIAAYISGSRYGHPKLCTGLVGIIQ